MSFLERFSSRYTAVPSKYGLMVTSVREPEWAGLTLTVTALSCHASKMGRKKDDKKDEQMTQQINKVRLQSYRHFKTPGASVSTLDGPVRAHRSNCCTVDLRSVGMFRMAYAVLREARTSMSPTAFQWSSLL